jgi:hypothetical protein
MVAEFLQQHPLGLGIGEVGRWRVDAFPLLLRVRCGAVRSWKGGTRRRCLGAVRRVPDITQPSSLITSTPTGGSGLVRAGSPTGPIRAAGCHHPGHTTAT